MPALSAAEALAIAEAFFNAHDVVDDYMRANWSTMPKPDRERLQSLAVTLYQNANDLVTHAVGAAVDDLTVSASGIAKATDRVKRALKKINQVKKVIDVATALIGFAAAIPTGNAVAVFQAGKHALEVAGVDVGKLKSLA